MGYTGVLEGKPLITRRSIKCSWWNFRG